MRRVGRLQINLVTRGIDILLLCALAALPVTTPAQQRLLVVVRLIYTSRRILLTVLQPQPGTAVGLHTRPYHPTLNL